MPSFGKSDSIRSSLACFTRYIACYLGPSKDNARLRVHGFGCGCYKLSRLDTPGSPVSALSAGITRFSAPLARSLFQPHFIWTCNLLFRRFIGFALRYTPASIMRALPNAPLRAKRRGRGSPTACMECRIRKQKVTGCVPRGLVLITNLCE
jgi:hypothetical protein